VKRTEDITTGAQTFTPDGVEEIEALGPDFPLLCDQFQGLLIVLAKLRTQTDHLREDTIRMGINDVVRKLGGAVEGISSALIREHHVAGFSLTHLAECMNVALSTAQGRRDRVLRENPQSGQETWAVQNGPRDVTSANFVGDQGNRRVIDYCDDEMRDAASRATLRIVPRIDPHNRAVSTARNFIIAMLKTYAPAAITSRAIIAAARSALDIDSADRVPETLFELPYEKLIGSLTIDGKTSFYFLPQE